MVRDAGEAPHELTIHALRKTLLQYAQPDLRQAILQLLTTFVPYIALWVLLIYLVVQKYPLAGIFALIFIAAEYRAASRMRRLAYRLYRHPFVLLGIGPGFSFLITQRFLHQWEGKYERFSAAVTNLAILVIILAAILTIGLRTYVLIQLPIILIAGTIGVWLFYVQHQFEGAYWARHENWDPVQAALKGSSYYKRPKVLQWFSGNIGLYHIHHLLPQIPNYLLHW